jgi:hypothetical protein
MLINNLGSLKAELARYMMHQRFQPDYDTAVQNFEAVANRRLRTREMESSLSLVNFNPDGSVLLPADYLLWRGVHWYGRTPGVDLDYVHPTYLDTTHISKSGDPEVFSIQGPFLTVRAIPTGEFNYVYFRYYGKIPTINGNDNNSNWLIQAHPDLYLYGALFELFVLGRNGEAAAAYKPLRDEKFAELIQLSALTTGATSSKVRSETAEYF